MKNATLAFAMIAVMSLSACAGGGDWTPMSAGRTAGEGQVEHTAPTKADRTFSGSHNQSA